MKMKLIYMMLCVSSVLGLSACSVDTIDLKAPQETVDEPGTGNETDTGNDIPPSDIRVELDLTNSQNTLGEMRDMWLVANRISPTTGGNVRPGLKINTVRMIGGIKKNENGVNVPDLEFDTAFYDETLGDYVYDFSPLIDRINKIRNRGTDIHQIVLDQPPWAFQRGYTFIPEGQKDNVNFRENERISIYGNSLPPYDKAEYAEYIEALMTKLIDEYGKDEVKTWRFRVGSEIETPDHWFGTEADFVEHFANTEGAVRKVLPEAIFGVHTRPPSFIYKSGTVTNYKSEVIKSFANAIIEYADQNNIRIDFWGISDYPIITSEKTRHPKDKYEELFAQLVEHPKWKDYTVLDLEEFSIISKIGSGYLITSDTAQADTLLIAMTDELHKKGIDQIFQWGQRKAEHEDFRTKALADMASKVRYPANLISTGNANPDDIGVIVATNSPQTELDILLYNYNPADLEAESSPEILTSIKMEVPVGSVFSYRKRLLSKENKKFQVFMEEPGADDYLIKNKGSGFNKYGNGSGGVTSNVLTAEGQLAFEQYVFTNTSEWTDWQQIVTVSAGNGEAGSVMHIESKLPLFSYEKIEVKKLN